MARQILNKCETYSNKKKICENTKTDSLSNQKYNSEHHGNNFSHKTEKCFVLQKQNKNKTEKSNNSKNKANSAYTHSQNRNESCIPLLCLKIGDQKIRAIIDTGATDTLISSKIVNRLKDLKFSTVSWKATTANKTSFASERKAHFEFSFEGLSTTKYKISALEVPNLNCEILFGMKDLIRFNAIININEGTITLDNKTFEINVREIPSHQESDNLIYTTKEKLNQLINKAKASNPIIRNIDSFNHRIIWKTKTPIRLKPYRLLYENVKVINLVIQRLLKLNLIRHSDSSYMTPVFLIPKKDKGVRLVSDYRAINRGTIKDPFPIPSIHDLIYKIKKKKIKKFVNSYYTCLKTKVNPKKYVKLSRFIETYGFNELISIDILGPIKCKHFAERLNHQYFYLIVMKDTFSRYSKIFVCFRIRSLDVIKAVNHWIKILVSHLKYYLIKEDNLLLRHLKIFLQKKG